ncbi:unnamed protein product [Paramecium primaurelia]|uniref:Uncharacterized protein n=1 Tax=Paramecium primaurelia TaxID=5886 RepID=A0A8S1QTT9_PARPR|nr:unnamed protein product [Paramecium primaurelia]
MNSEQIVTLYKNKVEECVEGVQQYLDCSFNKINAYLDQLLLDPYPSIPIKNLNLVVPVVQIQIPSTKTLINQLIEEVKPIINSTIYKKLNKNQKTYIKFNNRIKFYKIIIINQILNHSIIIQYRIIQLNKLNSVKQLLLIKKIQQYQLNLKQIQLISEHQLDVTSLNFMKKLNQFISGSNDNQIIIWCMDQCYQWISSQKLNEHKDDIDFLLLNNNEDLLLSGSNDKTIKFWINTMNGYVINYYRSLIIEQSSQDQKWNVIQKIKVLEYALSMIMCSLSNLYVENKCMFMRSIILINSTQRQKKLLLNVIILYVITISLNNISSRNA